MHDSVVQQIVKLNIERKHKKRRYRVVSILAALVVFCTTYALILPAITLEQEYYCGLAEHIHDASCYETKEEKVLICTREEISMHTHTQDCYDATGTLLCPLPQTHEHNEYCYSNDGTFICTLDELLPHTHTDECYTLQPTEVCICGLPEHIHDEDRCTVDPTNETETPEQWEASLPTKKTGQLAADLLSIAQSQLGYAESGVNLRADAEGNLNGYTRYGDLYNTPYGGWNALFVNFCLHYTSPTAFDALTAAGPEALRTLWAENGLYAEADSHTATPGDLLFMDMDKNGKAEYAGIVTGFEGVAPTVILGDWKDEVAMLTLDDSSVILGYGKTQQVPATGIQTQQTDTSLPNTGILPPTDDASINTQTVAEYAEDDSNFRKLEENGFFTYWEQFMQTETSAENTNADKSSLLQAAQANTPEDNADPQATPPSDEQIDFYGGTNVSDDGEVTVSKTIEGTDIENIFDITLTVTSRTNLEIYQKDPDMAIVIVMDISNTMRTAYGDSSRYEAAVTAAENFIDKFEENAPEATNAKLGFVAFNTSGHEIFALQDCTSPAQATALKNEMRQDTGAIINASGYPTAHTRFTNVEAGLTMAYDMLNEADANNKFIIFLSDGFPTTYMNNSTSAPYDGYDPYCSSGTPGVDGVFYDSVLGVHCDSGTSYSDKAAIRAREAATAIKDAGANIFSIGVDVGGQTIQKYIDQSEGFGNFSVVDRTGTTYEIGEPASQASYENWLRDSIGSGYYYDTTNYTELDAAFQTIFDEIKRIQEENTSEIWTAIDPIPFYGQEGECVEFIHFYDTSGNVADRLNGEYAEGAENSAVFVESDGHIDWDLKHSGYESETIQTENGSTTTYSYSMTYRVRLQNEKENFVENNIYETNATTTLTYQLVTTVNDVPSYSELRTVNFPLPSVFGYVCDFEFDKVDHNRVAMKDVPFTLAHDDERCTLCGGDGAAVTTVGPYTVLSDGVGHVKFPDVPSGHIYTLTETVPDGYKTNGDTYAVTIAYNELTVTVTHADGTSEDISEHGIGQIVNIPEFIPETESLLVQKDLRTSDATEPSALLTQTKTFTFRVMQADENGNATDVLFLPPGTAFDIIEDGVPVGTGTIGTDGTFTLRHGQIAVFDNLLTESAGGSFVVQELIEADEVLNYTSVDYVAGTVAGIPTQSVTDGYTAFTSSALSIEDYQSVLFRNTVDTQTLGTLTVTKALAGEGFAADETFRIQVTFDGTPVPVGTVYTVGDEQRTVTEEGVITLAADETAVFSGLPQGTQYTVRELLANDSTVGTTLSNVALHKDVIYTSYTKPGNWYAYYITDGETVTNYWDGDLAPAYYIIDLGAKYSLSYFHVYNYCGDTRYYNYVVEASLDNSSYTQIAASGDSLSTASGTRINLSQPVEARYLKVTVGRNAAATYKYVHTIEFEAYGYTVDESACAASYSGTVSAGGTVNLGSDGADGTLPANGSADITVTNEKYPFSVPVPIQKTTVDFSGTASFAFTVEQVEYGTWEVLAEQNGVRLQVTDSATASATASVVFAAGTTGTYYYRIRETDTGGHFAYDSNFYIVEITAYGTHAQITAVYKNGSEAVGTEDISFVNTATADVLITKTVDAPTTSGSFTFTAAVTKNGEAVSLPEPPADALYTVQGNVITFTLQNNESLLLTDLPYGAIVSITEVLPNDAYMPYYRIEDVHTELVYGDTATLTLDSSENAVHFVNKAYYELPDTGGSGTWMYTTGGLLMTAAAIFLLYKRKRERKGENALS